MLNLHGPSGKQSICIKVPKHKGEKALVLAHRLEVADDKLEIQRDEGSIYLPLTSQLTKEELNRTRTIFAEKVADSEFLTRNFVERKKRKITAAELLEDELSPSLLMRLPHAADIVGDIAIVKIPPELDTHKGLIGEAILRTKPTLRTVLAQESTVNGTYRLREFSIIAGEPRTETIHTEYGCRYYVDVEKVYFSPRLSYEHHRVASLVDEGETIVDMFTGVGSFSIQIAKAHENVRIYAIDMNPCAYELLKRNITLNKVDAKVNPILGDAREIISSELLNVANRVIMNLPKNSFEFIDVACQALKTSGGTVHFYSFATASINLDTLKTRFTESVKRTGRHVEKVLLSRTVRETAPYESQIVLDGEVQ
jgi:tRNA (guanine37-N1)-methyltransferase